jgi:glycerol-3-phosphate cytidylyltransferase
MSRILTCGTFDVFHIGHLRMLRRAKELGEELYVGVSSDQLNFSKKKRYPIYDETQRMEIVNGLKSVNFVFLEESLEAKKDYILKYDIDLFVIGDDWKGKFDHLKSVCDVLYLERTPSISTTELIEIIKIKN